MHFQLLRPTSPIDVHRQSFTSLEAFLNLAPILEAFELQTEDEAVTAVRALYPHAACVPAPVEIGGMIVWTMGVVEPEDEHVPSGNMSCVLFVMAVPESLRDRARIAQYSQFTQAKWRPQLHRPVLPGSSVHSVEVRATDLNAAMHVSAVVGRTHDGSPVIALELAGVALSIRFEGAQDIHIEPASDPARTVGRGEGTVGASYDPHPVRY